MGQIPAHIISCRHQLTVPVAFASCVDNRFCVCASQGRVSDAHLRGEAACAQLQDKLDLSGAALQTATANHKELEKQKRAVDKKLVSPPGSSRAHCSRQK